jgi:hypothetical protein
VGLFADENEEKVNADLLTFYDSELIHINNVNKFKFGDDTYNIGLFGISRDFKDILSTYPDSKSSIKSYSRRNIAGNVIYWSSAATWISFIVATGITEDYSNLSRNYGIGAAVFVGGALIYSIISSSARGKLYESINMYNRNKINEYK